MLLENLSGIDDVHSIVYFRKCQCFSVHSSISTSDCCASVYIFPIFSGLFQEYLSRQISLKFFLHSVQNMLKYFKTVRELPLSVTLAQKELKSWVLLRKVSFYTPPPKSGTALRKYTAFLLHLAPWPSFSKTFFKLYPGKMEWVISLKKPPKTPQKNACICKTLHEYQV